MDVSQQWTQPNGESLLPSRWNDLELAKNKGLDNDDSNGRCLGWRCLAWVRCQNHKDMIHTMFGGNRNGNDSGWTALSKVSLLSGAANFLGGLPVLKHSVVKIAEFLHSQHSDKLTGLQANCSCLDLIRPSVFLMWMKSVPKSNFWMLTVE